MPGQSTQSAREALAHCPEFPALTVAVEFGHDQCGFRAQFTVAAVMQEFLTADRIHHSRLYPGHRAKSGVVGVNRVQRQAKSQALHVIRQNGQGYDKAVAVVGSPFNRRNPIGVVSENGK